MKPALWKVADEDTTIYLFGTIHVLPKNLVWFEGPVAKALDESEQFITEIPDAPAAEQQKAVQAVGLLSGKYAGDVVEVQAPGGVREYEVLEVRYI